MKSKLLRKYFHSNIWPIIKLTNFTESYIRIVSQRTGIDADRRVNTRLASDMIPIVRAMSEVENGVAAILEDVEEGWSLYFDQ